MKLSKEGKREKARTLAEDLKESSQFFLTEYQGLKFRELSELRSRLRPIKAKYRVLKNSLMRHAFKQAGLEDDFDKLLAGSSGPTGRPLVPEAARRVLTGPVGMVIGPAKLGGDPVAATKVLVSFGKDFPQLKIRAGYIDNKWLSRAQCEQLSKLGTRTEMLTSLAQVLAAPLHQLVGVLGAPLRDLVLVLAAWQKKKEGEAK